MSKPNNYTNTLHTASPGSQNKPLIYHSGTIDSQSISLLLQQAENYLLTIDSSTEIRRKILEIMIELLQNIYHHNAINVAKNEQDAPTLLFEKKKNKFVLTTTNIVHKKSITSLEKRISNLNSSTPEELTMLYQKTLKTGNLLNEHAGLGWIDIRRKSESPILAKFTPIDNNYSLFTVSVLV